MMLFCMLLAMGHFVPKVWAEEKPEHKYDEIKVAYMVNFIRLSVWPDLNQDHPDKPMNITIISSPDFFQIVKSAFPKGEIQDRKVQLTHWTALEMDGKNISDQQLKIIKQSHLIYLSQGRLFDLQTLKKTNPTPPYLLIGDMPKFAQHGGMIGLHKRQSGIAFTVNIKAIRQADLFISSKVLRLGTPVKEITSPSANH